MEHMLSESQPLDFYLPLCRHYLQGIICEDHLQAFFKLRVSLLAKKIWFALSCVQGKLLFTWTILKGPVLKAFMLR